MLVGNVDFRWRCFALAVAIGTQQIGRVVEPWRPGGRSLLIYVLLAVAALVVDESVLERVTFAGPNGGPLAALPAPCSARYR